MKTVTCPNPECGISNLDPYVDRCPNCGQIAPGGVVAQICGEDTPRMVCRNVGPVEHVSGVIAPGQYRIFDEKQALLDGERCMECGRENPTTTRYEDVPWWSKKGDPPGSPRVEYWVRRQGFWLAPLCGFFAAVKWGAITTLPSLPTFIEGVKSNPEFFKSHSPSIANLNIGLSLYSLLWETVLAPLLVLLFWFMLPLWYWGALPGVTEKREIPVVVRRAARYLMVNAFIASIVFSWVSVWPSILWLALLHIDLGIELQKHWPRFALRLLKTRGRFAERSLRAFMLVIAVGNSHSLSQAFVDLATLFYIHVSYHRNGGANMELTWSEYAAERWAFDAAKLEAVWYRPNYYVKYATQYPGPLNPQRVAQTA